jgi:SAM-dependent methyltransferase
MSDLVRHAQTMLGQSGTQSILDVGCGSGLLHRHLLANGFTLQYRGIDLSEKFIAKARLDYPGIPFSVCDVLNDRDLKELEPHDYIVCNGIFTQKLATSEADMRAHFESFISRLWSKCGVGLAFNAIAEDAVDWRKDNLFYLGYSSLAKFLKEKISTKYVFRKDYGLYEFTAYVFK